MQSAACPPMPEAGTTSRGGGHTETPVRSRGNLRRKESGPSPLSRQLALAAMAFAVLVLGIIFLFGHLIASSLSKRYLEDVLLTGREDAERLAEQLKTEGGTDLLQVMSKRQEALVRTLGGLAQKKVLESVEVTDASGNVVFTSFLQSTEDIPPGMVPELELRGELSNADVRQTEHSYQIAVPAGEVGEVVLNVSKVKLAERVQQLRSELLRQTVSVAVLTMSTLLVAFGFVWLLIQRNRRLETARHEAEELAALGTLAANLAHEIRNPLNSINLNLELLEEDLAVSPSDSSGSLASTRQEVSRLARLVSDFLTYARPSEPHFEPVRLVSLLHEVAEFLRTEARAMATHLRLAPDIPDIVIQGDSAQLRQVLLNLVLNSIQAVAPLEPAERRVVELDAVCEDDRVVLSVRDRGIGIPGDQLERVRRAFVTNRRGGTGLGLAIADRIVTAHGGELELENLPAGGFEARIVLPGPSGDGNMTE